MPTSVWREQVQCNARLKALLGEDSIRLSSLAERLGSHLSPAPPAVMDFTVRCGAGPSARLPVILIGSPLDFAACLIGSPITLQSTGPVRRAGAVVGTRAAEWCS